MTLGRFFSLLAVVLVLWWAYKRIDLVAPHAIGEGRPSTRSTIAPPSHDQPPAQEAIKPFTWTCGPYTVTAVARYAVTARLAGIRRYRWDQTADLIPYDFALFWGSTRYYLDSIKVEQNHRWYTWTSRSLVLKNEEIAHSSANTHIIPQDKYIMSKLETLNVDDEVVLIGYLVNLKHRDGFTMNSSTSRTDTGAGACEIFWVDEVYRR